MVKTTLEGDQIILRTTVNYDEFDSVILEKDNIVGWREQQVFIMWALTHGRTVTLKMEIPR